MRVRFHVPEGRITKEILTDALSLAGARIPEESVVKWTHIECIVAYDWAMREHLSRSDNHVKRRPRPSFVSQAIHDTISL